MAHSLSAKKRVRRVRRRTLRNKAIRSQHKTHTGKAQNAMAGDDIQAAEQAVRKAVSVLDKACQKGILHRNKAARRKSQLAKRLNQVREQSQS